MDLKQYIRDIPDFPKPGVVFKDITPLLQHPEAFSYIVDKFAEYLTDIDKIVAIDSRWFLFGAPLAYKLKKPLIIVRKKWKLPFKTISAEYQLEYWMDVLEMHIDSIEEGDRVVIVDDVLATWWTAKAVCDLVFKAWWEVEKLLFLIELEFLKWREKLKDCKVISLIRY